MPLKRRKISRKVVLTKNQRGNIFDLPPGWKFTISCQHHGEKTYDFTPLIGKGREDLARHMRDAFWSLRHDLVGKTLHLYWKSLQIFWRFLDDMKTSGELITHLDQIDRKVLDSFITWMEGQISTRKNKGRLWTLGAKKCFYDSIKALFVNRQKSTPEDISLKLSFPRNPFPNYNRERKNYKGYSKSEQERILNACRLDLEKIYKGEWDGTPLQVLIVHLIVIGFYTGRNPTPLMELRRDALKSSPIEDREIIVTHKRRGYSTHITSFRKEDENLKEKKYFGIPKSVGSYIRFVIDYTAPLIEDASAEDSDYIFLWRLSHGKRKGDVARLDNCNLLRALLTFVKRHDLVDDRGKTLKLNLSCIRTTAGNNVYYSTGGDIRKTQSFLGHSNPNITTQTYVKSSPESERNLNLVQAAMSDWVTCTDDKRARRFAADNKIPLKDARNLLKGGYNTAIARCKNPFRENGGTCGKYMKCFNCPNMIVFEDDLYRLFSFYYRLLSERSKITQHHWLKTYGWVIKKIDEQIAPQFHVGVVEEARQEALKDPHPVWKGVAS